MTKKPTRRGGPFPRTLDQLVGTITRPALKAYGLAGSRIVSDWEQIVGSAIAKHATPAGVRFPPGKKANGTLIIHVASAYALELQHLQPYLIEKLASYFGYRAISRIHLTQAGAPMAQTPVTPPPLPVQAMNTQHRHALTQEINAVTDEALKAALAQLHATVFG